jgi:hypothetical protein
MAFLGLPACPFRPALLIIDYGFSWFACLPFSSSPPHNRLWRVLVGLLSRFRSAPLIIDYGVFVCRANYLALDGHGRSSLFMKFYKEGGTENRKDFPAGQERWLEANCYVYKAAMPLEFRKHIIMCMAQQNSVSTKNPTYWDICHFFKEDLEADTKTALMAAKYAQHAELIASCGLGNLQAQWFRNLKKTWSTLQATTGANEILPEVCDSFTYSKSASKSSRPPVVNNQTFAQNLAWTKLCTDNFQTSEEGNSLRVSCLKILRDSVFDERNSAKDAEGQLEWTREAKNDPFVVTQGGDMSEVTQLMLTRREVVYALNSQVKSNTCTYNKDTHCNEIR